MSFASKLQEIRVENNISQEGLAEMLGVSRQSVSKWERGKGYPEIDKLIFISERFGVSLDELLKEKKDASGNPRHPINLTKDTPQSVRVEYPENSATEEIYPERKPYAEAVDKNFFNGEVVSDRAGIARYTNYSYSEPNSQTAGKTVKRRRFNRIINRIVKRRRIILAVCFIVSFISFITLVIALNESHESNVYISNEVYDDVPPDEVYSYNYWLDEEYPMRYMIDESTGTRYIFDCNTSDGIVTDLNSTDISECVKVTEISTGEKYFCNQFYSEHCVVILSDENICYVIPSYMVQENLETEMQKYYTAYQDINTRKWCFVPNWIIEKADEGLDGNVIIDKNSEDNNVQDDEASDMETEDSEDI